MSALALLGATLPASALNVAPVQLYQQWLAEAPIVTKAVTSSALYAVGDVVAQTRQRIGPEPLSVPRLLRFAGTGLGAGVLWHGYYGFSDAQLSSIDEPVARVACAMLLEQFVWCPVLYSLYVIPLSAALNGAGASALPSEVRERIGPLLIANAKVWTPANLIIYSTPLEYRVLASNGIDIIWAAVCADVAASCGSDDACLVAQPNAVMGEDGCALPAPGDDDSGVARVQLEDERARL
jgi:hypothetical protein